MELSVRDLFVIHAESEQKQNKLLRNKSLEITNNDGNI